ncbi:MAG TPA: TonB-dependent receptor plug domain-containing protein, partial [Spirochaetota bacterium]|nr:TonB-dependent receptor plug domain-containing protein [Spirochaetota bacterium]
MLKINNCFISLLFFLSIAPAIYAQDNGSTPDNLTGIIEAAAPPTNAQTGEVALDDVIISAYKSNITYAESASVAVITQKDIEKGGYRFVSDVLQSVSGLQLVQSSTLGGTASVFIRGAKTGNMVVLIDGVKVNDISTIERTFDFATLATDSIERIEIIKGPQSALYGSDATGGIINIVTKKGKGKPAVTVNMYAGSYYTTQQSANISGGDSSLNYSLTAGQISAQGYSKAAKPKNAAAPFDDDGFYQRYATGKFEFTPVAPLLIDAGFTAKKSAIEVDDSSYTDDPNSDEERTELSGYTTIKHTIASFWEQSVT